MTLLVRLGFILLLSSLAFHSAQSQQLVTGLSVDKVEIQSDFTGTELVVFGTVDGIDQTTNTEGEPSQSLKEYDIIIVIEGPREPGIIRKKAQTFGIWINQGGVELSGFPGSYLMKSTKSPEDENFKTSLAAFGIGFEHVPLKVKDGKEATQEYRRALVRLKQENGLYQQSTGVELLGTNLFRAKFQLPAVVPVGIHQVRSYLLHNNSLASGATQAIRISKSGFEQWIYRFAHDYGFIYGAICVLMAMLTGWLGSVIFRRD